MTTLRFNADHSHPSAVALWAALEWSTTWEVLDAYGAPEADGEVMHPVCSPGQFREHDDEALLEILAPRKRCSPEERGAYREAIEYGRLSWATAQDAADALERAVVAYRAGDVGACLATLDEAAEHDASESAANLRSRLVA